MAKKRRKKATVYFKGSQPIDAMEAAGFRVIDDTILPMLHGSGMKIFYRDNTFYFAKTATAPAWT